MSSSRGCRSSTWNCTTTIGRTATPAHADVNATATLRLERSSPAGRSPRPGRDAARREISGRVSLEFTLPPGELDRIFVEPKPRACAPSPPRGAPAATAAPRTRRPAGARESRAVRPRDPRRASPCRAGSAARGPAARGAAGAAEAPRRAWKSPTMCGATCSSEFKPAPPRNSRRRRRAVYPREFGSAAADRAGVVARRAGDPRKPRLARRVAWRRRRRRISPHISCASGA